MKQVFFVVWSETTFLLTSFEKEEKKEKWSNE